MKEKSPLSSKQMPARIRSLDKGEIENGQSRSKRKERRVKRRTFFFLFKGSLISWDASRRGHGHPGAAWVERQDKGVCIYPLPHPSLPVSLVWFWGEEGAANPLKWTQATQRVCLYKTPILQHS